MAGVDARRPPPANVPDGMPVTLPDHMAPTTVNGIHWWSPERSAKMADSVTRALV